MKMLWTYYFSFEYMEEVVANFFFVFIKYSQVQIEIALCKFKNAFNIMRFKEMLKTT